MSENPTYRKLAVYGLAILLLIIATVVVFRISVNSLKKSTLEEVSAELFSESILEAETIRLRFFPFGFTLSDIKLDTPENYDFSTIEKPGDLISSLRIEQIQVKGLKLFTFLFQDRLKINQLNINSPNIEMIAAKTGRDRLSEITSNDNSGNGNSGRQMEISEFNLNDLYLIGLNDIDKINSNLFEVNDLSLNIKSIQLNQNGNSANELPENISFSLHEFIINLPNDHYSLTTDVIEYNGADSTLSIRSSKLKPLLTPQLMSVDIGHELDHFDIVSGPIELHRIDPGKIFHSNQLVADSMLINGLRIYISRDKNFDDKPRTEKPIPTVKLANLPYGISIDKIHWKNGLINYREWREGQVESGDILFDEVDIILENVQNLDNTQNFDITAYTKFFGKTDMDVMFDVSLDDVGTHHISGTIAGFDLEELNPVLKPLAFAKIKSGNLDSIAFQFTLDDYKAEGEFIAIYNDLEMRFLDEESLEETNMKRVASFFANLVGVRSNNRAEDPKIGEIYLERDRERSVFTYWWKSLQTGIESGISQ